MARDFFPTTFFHRVPNTLLGRYFHENFGVLEDIAFDELPEKWGTAEAVFK